MVTMILVSAAPSTSREAEGTPTSAASRPTPTPIEPTPKRKKKTSDVERILKAMEKEDGMRLEALFVA